MPSETMCMSQHSPSRGTMSKRRAKEPTRPWRREGTYWNKTKRTISGADCTMTYYAKLDGTSGFYKRVCITYVPTLPCGSYEPNITLRETYLDLQVPRTSVQMQMQANTHACANTEPPKQAHKTMQCAGMSQPNIYIEDRARRGRRTGSTA